MKKLFYSKKTQTLFFSGSLNLSLVILAIGGIAKADYWKCPADDTHYSSKKEAQRECDTPQRYGPKLVERKGALGRGGIAGTGIGSPRASVVEGPIDEDENSFWKCPGSKKRYNTQAAAKQVCEQPRKYKRELKERKGILGAGGIAGTGIGKKRAYYVDEPVAD